MGLLNPNQASCEGAQDCNGHLYWVDDMGVANFTNFEAGHRFELKASGDNKKCFYASREDKIVMDDCSKYNRIICQFNCLESTVV